MFPKIELMPALETSTNCEIHLYYQVLVRFVLGYEFAFSLLAASPRSISTKLVVFIFRNSPDAMSGVVLIRPQRANQESPSVAKILLVAALG
jgi:hypothetical protein